jgi:hypothetical protein
MLYSLILVPPLGFCKSGMLLDRYLTWWYGTDRVIQTEGANKITLEILVEPNTDKGLTLSVLFSIKC